MADELNPAQEARLRRLLARSRHDESVPDDVAARLDDVLARLEAGDPFGEPLAHVHELAARRRRKVTSLLVAAAAVVVLGVGLGQVLDDLRTGSDSVSTVDSSAEELTADSALGRTDEDPAAGGGVAGTGPGKDAGRVELGPQGSGQDEMSQFSAESGAAPGYDGLAAQEALGDLLVVRNRLVQVLEEDFGRSATRIRRQLSVPIPASGRTVEEQAVALSRSSRRVQRVWQACAPTDVGEGTGVAVVYEGGPAILVLRPPMGDTQVVELLQCGTGSPLRTVTLPSG